MGGLGRRGFLQGVGAWLIAPMEVPQDRRELRMGFCMERITKGDRLIVLANGAGSDMLIPWRPGDTHLIGGIAIEDGATFTWISYEVV